MSTVKTNAQPFEIEWTDGHLPAGIDAAWFNRYLDLLQVLDRMPDPADKPAHFELWDNRSRILALEKNLALLSLSRHRPFTYAVITRAPRHQHEELPDGHPPD